MCRCDRRYHGSLRSLRSLRPLRPLRSRRSLGLLGLLGLLFCCSPFALVRLSGQPSVVPDEIPGPALVAQLPPGEQPLTIQSVRIEADVVGVLAETSMTMTFYNPNRRPLAGDFTFPLPEGATVSGYALDVNGVMIDGVPVEKQKGREVFETEVRKGVDPGLIEQTKGNTFKTRVYPIPSQGTRTIRVKYISGLVRQDESSLYVLPLAFGGGVVKELSLRVMVRQAEVKPQIQSGSLTNFSFSAWNHGFLAETKLEQQKLGQTLRIAIPDAGKASVALEKDDKGDCYFFIHDVVTQPTTQNKNKGKDPERIAIFWDASASREQADVAREKNLMTRYFRKFVGKTVKLDLIVFRNQREPLQTFDIHDGDLQPLFDVLASTPYDGGTSLGSLTPENGDPVPDVALLFSDGISNFGIAEPASLKFPLYCCVSSANANYPFLQFLAQKTGGAVLNLDALTDDAAVAIIGQPVFSFLSLTCEGGTVEETYPNLPRMVSKDFFLAGRLEKKDAKITINYGTGSTVMVSNTFHIAAADAILEGDLLRRFWAQRKVEELQVHPKKNREQITDIGKKYGIVTPETSLIVLERPEQYIEHAIVPPKNMPDWRQSYFSEMERRASAQKGQRASKLERAVSMWQRRLDWYDTDFTQTGAAFGSKSKSPGEARGGATRGAMDATMSPSNDSLGVPGARRLEEPRMPSGRVPMPMARPANANMEATTEMVDGLEMRGTDVMSDSLAVAGSAKADREAQIEPGRRPVDPGVVMKAWDPKTPYLSALQNAAPQAAYQEYLAQRREYRTSPAFYLDCADFFCKNEQSGIGLRVLSNIAELEMENPALMRVLAHRLAQLDETAIAAMIFEEVLELRREEPQSYRDLALVLGRMGQYARAVELLYEVVLGTWDGRFPEIEVIALAEMNNLLARAEREGIEVPVIDPRLCRNMELDIRIVMTWDTDLTDMDLWVLEPSGEKAYYSNNRTRIGGLVSRDFTQGYGPEEYLLRKSMHGIYTIQTNFYGSRAQNLVGAVTLQVDVFSNFGRPNEKRRSMTMRLTGSRETFTVAEMEF